MVLVNFRLQFSIPYSVMASIGFLRRLIQNRIRIRDILTLKRLR